MATKSGRYIVVFKTEKNCIACKSALVSILLSFCCDMDCQLSSSFFLLKQIAEGIRREVRVAKLADSLDLSQ